MAESEATASRPVERAVVELERAGGVAQQKFSANGFGHLRDLSLPVVGAM
jgi:hypothetical protein